MGKLDRLNPILEALKHSPELINKIFIQKEKRSARIADIIRLARNNSVPFIFVPRNTLDRFSHHHQGAVAELAAKEFTPLEDILQATALPFLVVLDEIDDPQNLGAIIRSAEAAGVDGIIIPERRSAGLTETVATVSSGALAYVKIARVVNLVRTIEELKKSGISVVGAEASAAKLWFEFDFNQPVAIVLGSEGRGLRPLVRRSCDQLLSIKQVGKVNSLNVASAAAVFFFEVIRQRKC